MIELKFFADAKFSKPEPGPKYIAPNPTLVKSIFHIESKTDKYIRFFRR